MEEVLEENLIFRNVKLLVPDSRLLTEWNENRLPTNNVLVNLSVNIEM